MVATRERPSARETAFGGEIELRFPFDQALVDGLKESIPPRLEAAITRLLTVDCSEAPMTLGLVAPPHGRADGRPPLEDAPC